MSNRDWWEQWREATAAKKWDGEMTTSVEEMYQAFKARLLEEMEGIYEKSTDELP